MSISIPSNIRQLPPAILRALSNIQFDKHQKALRMNWVYSICRSMCLSTHHFGYAPMSGRHTFQPEPGTRFASKNRMRAVSTPHTPRQNRLLAALPLEEYERLLPDLEPVPLPPGWTVHSAGDCEKYLYFL